ncbi:hypothetical protein VNI00_018768 [Paramarasmius palmivorus]|uniref:Ribonuclease H1 N-terminal domain-containing protein n=1 Tax=Paramarasmius palmivorus TaxID=297713 RepID=A0AAW0ATW5_9AGAR
MQTTIIDEYTPRPPSPVNRREGNFLVVGRPPNGQALAYMTPQAFNCLEHEPARGTTTVRTTVEEMGGLVITTITKIQRLHPDHPSPARSGPRGIATVANPLVAPTAQEEAAGAFYRDGNLYVAVDVPSNEDAPLVIALGPQSGLTQEALAAANTLAGHAALVSNPIVTATPAQDATLAVQEATPAQTATEMDDVESLSSEASVTFSDESDNNGVPGVPNIPHPDSFHAPADVPAGTRFYVVYVGREVGIFWGDWYEEVEHKVLGVSGFRATKHQTFTQAQMEYTRAYFNQKPGYDLRVVSDVTPTPA